MPIASAKELPGSPVEQERQEQITRYWSPVALLGTGVTISLPTCVVLSYDPANPSLTTDVSATVLLAGSPFLGSGVNAGFVGWTIARNTLVVGTEYRCMLGCTGSDGSVVAAYLRIRVLL